MTIGDKDKVYEKKVEKKRNRVEREEVQASSSKDRVQESDNPVENIEDGFEEPEGDDSRDDPDSDFNGNTRKRIKKPRKLMLEVPTDILQKTSLTSARCGISARTQTMSIAEVLKISGADLKEFKLSKTSANRYRKVEATKKAESVRESFSEKLEEIGRKFVLHFDGKLLEDITDDKKSVNERLAILLSSPDLSDPQLLGIPPLQAGTREEIAKGILDILQQWKVTSDHVVGMSFDTTASNTGASAGACVLLESELGRQLLYLACRHHIYELHIKHVAVKVARPTKGVDDPLFGRFRDSWNDISSHNLPTGNLSKLDYTSVPQLVAETGKEALLFLSKCLLENTFTRGDYKELCELAVVFLGGTVEKFSLKMPGKYFIHLD